MRLTGLVYRAHHPRWAFAPTSGAGAARFGGRFNPKGMDALYACLRLETAWLEAQQAFPFKAQPMTLCTYRVDCEDVTDLTSGAEKTRLGIADAELACAWEDIAVRGLVPPTRAIARRLFSVGVAAIIVRSYAAGATNDDVNVVFWRWSPDLPHRVELVDDLARLPKDDSSWR